jgi:iron(III) transport system ATP-binding protein
MYLFLDQLKKIFPARGGSGEVTAVNGVSLEIEKGELVTLLGPSGCGKTTVLRMIAGFEFPTEGKISLAGEDLSRLPPNKRSMSMVFQNYALFPHLNVRENISYGLKVMRLPKAEIQERMRRSLALVQLEGLEDRAPNQLSGGQQQRVALARALVMEPKVLLMDEPLSNLDAKLREQMRSEIRRIQRELGITSIYVTHDQIEAMTLSDKVVVMNQGVIEQTGTPVEIYRRPTSRFVAGFIGRANFVRAKVIGHDPGGLVVDLFGQQVVLPTIKERYPSGAFLTLVIRPEMIRLNKNGGSGLRGRVQRTIYLGNSVDYEVGVGNQVLTAVENDPLRMELLPEGNEVNCEFSTIHPLLRTPLSGGCPTPTRQENWRFCLLFSQSWLVMVLKEVPAIPCSMSSFDILSSCTYLKLNFQGEFWENIFS